MERAWPEGRRARSTTRSSPFGLWARSNKDVFYTPCAHLRTQGGRLKLAVPAGLLRRPGLPRLRHGALHELVHAPAHDFVIHRALREVPPRNLVALKTHCLVSRTCCGSSSAVEALARRRHCDGTRSTALRRSSSWRASKASRGWRRSRRRSRSRGGTWRVTQCLNGHSLLPPQHAGHREDPPGEADRRAAIGEGRGGDADLEDTLQRAEPGPGRRRRTTGCGAWTHRHCRHSIAWNTKPWEWERLNDQCQSHWPAASFTSVSETKPVSGTSLVEKELLQNAVWNRILLPGDAIEFYTC